MGDYTKLYRRLNGTRDPAFVLRLLGDGLRKESLKLLLFCLDDKSRQQVKAVLFDDLDGDAQRLFARLERIVGLVKDLEIAEPLRLHHSVITRGSPEQPDSEVRPAESVSIEAYLHESGSPMGLLSLSDGRENVYTARASLPKLTCSATLLLLGVLRGFQALGSLVDFDRLPDRVKAEQWLALVGVLRVAKAISTVLGIDWEEIVRAADDDD